MNIRLYLKNGAYTFSINRSGKVLASPYLSRLVPSIKKAYQNSWTAYRDASRLGTDLSFHIDAIEKSSQVENTISEVSAEDALVSHYSKVLTFTRSEAKSSQGDKDEEDKVFSKIKIVIAEIEGLIRKLQGQQDKDEEEVDLEIGLRKLLGLFRQTKEKYFFDRKEEAKERIAKKESIMKFVFAKMTDALEDSVLKKEVLEDYGDRICKVVSAYYDHVIFKIDIDAAEIDIYEVNGESNLILSVKMNENYHIDSIIPLEDLYKIYPIHSVEFYQKYWKPIVEELGHFYVTDASTLVVSGKISLPDIPKDYPRSINIEGWNIKDKKTQTVALSFKDGAHGPLWIFEAVKVEKLASQTPQVTSKYTEQEYFNGIFKCINPQLKSIYGQTGAVIQVIPHTDFVEVDIDFGRGIGVVRLTEDKIEKVL